LTSPVTLNRSKEKRRVARALTRIYPFAAAIWALTLVLFARPVGPWSFAGAALVVVGWGLAFWAAGYSGAAGRDGADFFFAGPYGWVRNPSPLGKVGLALGLALWAGALWPWLAVATAVFLIWYYTVVQRASEEEAERRLSWDYRAWRATVPVWIPRFTRRPRLGTARWRLGAAFKNSLPLLAAAVFVAAAAAVGAYVDGVARLR
jgi:protein-S-isoprenylcysteine O-methyltransferase Ste14